MITIYPEPVYMTSHCMKANPGNVITEKEFVFLEKTIHTLVQHNAQFKNDKFIEFFLN